MTPLCYILYSDLSEGISYTELSSVHVVVVASDEGNFTIEIDVIVSNGHITLPVDSSVSVTMRLQMKAWVRLNVVTIGLGKVTLL